MPSSPTTPFTPQPDQTMPFKKRRRRSNTPIKSPLFVILVLVLLALLIGYFIYAGYMVFNSIFVL